MKEVDLFIVILLSNIGYMLIVFVFVCKMPVQRQALARKDHKDYTHTSKETNISHKVCVNMCKI